MDRANNGILTELKRLAENCARLHGSSGIVFETVQVEYSPGDCFT